MLSLHAEAVALRPDRSSAFKVPLRGSNGRGLAGASSSSGWSRGLVGFLALFRTRPWPYSTYERRRMGHPSGECRLNIVAVETQAPSLF